MTIEVNNEELSSLISEEEGDRLDFKSADLLLDPNGKNHHTIAKHIVGFANHNGGKLVFGVNDDREPEGKNLLKEKSLGTISELISTRISPSIEFSYRYFSDEEGDLTEGSVFVVDIQRNSSPIPHAIVERSGGEIEKREYRIRVGDSTRLVSNEELLALFEDHTNIALEYTGSIQFLLEDNNTPARTNFKPRYQYTFDRHFTELCSDEESLIDKIRDGHQHHSEQGMKRIRDTQYALTISTILSHPEFIFINERELQDRMHEQAGKLTFDIKSISPSDIVLDSDSNPLIDETDMDKPGLYPEYEPRFDYFKIPESASISIWEDFDGFNIYNSHFTLSLSIDLIEVGVGLPTPHPDSVPKPGEYGLVAQEKSNATMHAHISISSDFSYPEQEFDEFESYRAYCESVIDIFESTFDFEEYIDQLPNPLLLDINKRVSEICDEVERMK